MLLNTFNIMAHSTWYMTIFLHRTCVVLLLKCIANIDYRHILLWPKTTTFVGSQRSYWLPRLHNSFWPQYAVFDRWRLMQFVVTKSQNNWEPLVLTIPGRLWITWIYTGQWGQGITNCKDNTYSNMTFQMLWPLVTTNCGSRI